MIPTLYSIGLNKPQKNVRNFKTSMYCEFIFETQRNRETKVHKEIQEGLSNFLKTSVNLCLSVPLCFKNELVNISN
jgi:hypothetical protein